MTRSNGLTVNRSIKIIQETSKIQITKVFAENNLSKSALKYAEFTGTHYLWNWGRNGFIVVYELPQIFNSSFQEVLKYLVNYCMPYMQDEDLNDSVIYTRFMDNHNKSIKH